MKHTLYLLTLAAAMLVSPAAFGQDSQKCYNPEAGTPFIATYVCEFSPSGRVNVTETYNDTVTSNWYTADEWATKGPHLHKLWDQYNASVAAAAQAQIEADEAERQSQSLHNKKSCRAAGYKWQYGECM